MSLCGTKTFQSNLVLLQQHSCHYLSSDQDEVLILLSNLVSDLQSEDVTLEALQRQCEDSHLLAIAERLLLLKDRMITYLTKKLLCLLLERVPSLFNDHVFTSRCTSSLTNDGMALAFLQTIYRKMKKKKQGCSVDMHPVHKQILLVSVSSIITHFYSFLDGIKDGYTNDSDTESDNTNTNSSDNCIDVENLAALLNIVLMFLKIIKLQLKSASSDSHENIFTSLHYPQLVSCVCSFIMDLSNGYLATTHPHLLWRILTKALEKIVQIEFLHQKLEIWKMESADLTTKELDTMNLKPDSGPHSVEEVSSMLCRDSFQRRLVFVESGFCGPGGLETSQEMGVVMDDVSGRRLILFLLRGLLLRSGRKMTSDSIDLVLSASLHLLKKFPVVKEKRGSLSEAELFIMVFSEQDDQLLDLLNILFNAHLLIREGKSIHRSSINPHVLFNQLLHSISFDDTVLLDWLTSKESQISCSYIKDYLHFVKEDFQGCLRYLKEDRCAERTTIGHKRRGSMQCLVKETSEALSCDSGYSVEIDTCGSKGVTSGFGLVQYSSSEEEEEEEEGGLVEQPSNVDRYFSCLIRLNLKLDRLRTLNLVKKELTDIVTLLDDIESLYEEIL